MITCFILITLAAIAGFAAGFVAGVKNAASGKVAKAKAIVDTLKR